MQPEGYGSIPMDLHIPQQGYHAYYRKGHEDSPGPPVIQTRILEMRKEKSRDAARSRRGKENYEFYELAKMLPLPNAITTQLDKASIIRLTISFLKLKDFIAHGDPPWRRDGPSLKGGGLRGRAVSTDLFEQHQATHILQSLDGFAFALGSDGRFLYVSETVSIYLGLSQVEMTGSSIFDYIHQQDQSELADLIGINVCHSPPATSPASVASDDGSSSNPGTSTPTGFERPAPVMTINNQNGNESYRRSFCVRMKSTLTKRGCHFKSSGYRVVLVLANMRTQYAFSNARKVPPTIMGLVAVAIALPPPSVNELRLEQDMFVTRLTFDLRISHCEPRISDLLDYTADEITGRNMYSLCYAQDTERLRKCHMDLIQKGQVMTGYYRFMSKNGGFTWVQSCATVICNSKNAEEETIICVNYVLSNVEYEHCVMDYSQLPSSRELRAEEPSSSERGPTPDEEGGRDNSSNRDADQEQQTPRSEREEVSEPGESDKYDPVPEVRRKQDDQRKNENSSPMEKQGSPKFPGVNYISQNEMNQHLALERNDMGDRQIERTGIGRQRKRKHHQPVETNIADIDAKSPRSRPESTSSSLEVLSLDNGNYLSNDDGPDEIVSPSDEDMCHGAPQIANDSVDSNNENKHDKNGVSRPWTRSPVSAHNSGSASYPSDMNKNNSAMSVRELEDAMNRHLPHNGSPVSVNSPEVLMLKSYSSGAPAQHGHHPSSRSIQWIGGGSATLPATTLLRQIYVSRESVIRSGAHASRHGCYGDVQGTLPTPPGGQGEPGYGDAAQLMLQSKLTADAGYGVISGFTPATSTGVGGGYADSCNAMTPPSSVSPRDKFSAESSAFNEAAAVAAAAAMPHMRHYVTTDPNSLQHLPLKPQLFVHSGNLEHSAYGHPQQTLPPDQHQLYHHPSSFHLYHPAPGASKPTLHATNGASWFCQPHS